MFNYVSPFFSHVSWGFLVFPVVFLGFLHGPWPQQRDQGMVQELIAFAANLSIRLVPEWHGRWRLAARYPCWLMILGDYTSHLLWEYMMIYWITVNLCLIWWYMMIYKHINIYWLPICSMVLVCVVYLAWLTEILGISRAHEWMLASGIWTWAAFKTPVGWWL